MDKIIVAALRLLGWRNETLLDFKTPAWFNSEGVYTTKIPSEFELVGLLMAELEKAPCLGDFSFDGSLGGT